MIIMFILKKPQLVSTLVATNTFPIIIPVSLFLALTLGPLTADFSFQSKGRSC